MSRKRYPEEFKIEAVKQVTEAGYSAYDVAERLGTITNSLHSWIRRYAPSVRIVVVPFQKLSSRGRIGATSEVFGRTEAVCLGEAVATA